MSGSSTRLGADFLTSGRMAFTPRLQLQEIRVLRLPEAIVYWGNMRIVEKKMETTIWGVGFRVERYRMQWL